MTRPDPLALAPTARLYLLPTDAVAISAAELVAMRRAVTAACRLQASIRDRKSRREHRVPMPDLHVLEARLAELAAIVGEN